MSELVEIEDRELRSLVRYTLSYFLPTQPAMSGIAFKQIAHMPGTSVAQINERVNTYNIKMRITNALAN